MQGGGMAQVLQKGCGKEHGHPSPWGSLGVYNEGWGVPGSRGAVQVTPKGCSAVERGAGSRRLGSPWGCQPCRSWPGEEQHSRPPRPSPLQCHTSTWEHCLQVRAKLQGEDSHETALGGVYYSHSPPRKGLILNHGS